jgi:hypothetical protein
MISRCLSIRSMVMATVLVAVATNAFAAIETHDDTNLRTFQERTYQGKPIVFWLKALRSRNEDLLSGAFEAIRSLEKDAWVAVPDLTRVVAAPFVPIDSVKDSPETIAAKLYDIAVRNEAIDTLAWIGEPAASATTALVHWALTEHVRLSILKQPDDKEFFIELVTMDAEQRIRVARAVAAFGPATSPAVAKLLTSPDASKRKLAVAVLDQDALPIAAELLRSRLCEDRQLGLLVLKDMDLVVSQAHIAQLATQILEDCSTLSKGQDRPAPPSLSSRK